MGYRSDVMAVFYTYEPNEYPAMKLFIDENMPEVFKTDEYMRTFEGQNGKLFGVKFTMNGWKWYESYPEIQGFDETMRKFEELADEGSKWHWEFVRLGEEVEDVEERHSYNSENLIYVNRTIESDV